MSKKNSNVILRDGFKNHEDIFLIYNNFKKILKSSKINFFVIAVSGGPDSLALTALAKAFSYENKCKIHYVLIDHNLRKNSSKEANSVKNLLKKHNINLKILKNTKPIASNIQSQARDIRYNLLTSYCKKNKVKNILTAHNLEDQVETFFIRLSRGSGLDGLSCMKQKNIIKNNIKLVRPLLDYKKDRLIKITKLIFGKFYKDPTNKNKKYLRTRIRNLKSNLENSGINYDQIIKSINNLSSSRDTLDLYFDKIYKELITKKNNQITISFHDFSCFNEEMKMRVFKKCIQELSNSYYLSRSKKILNLINQIELKQDEKFTLGGCIILRDKNFIILRKG
tara:strand:- start:1001 stop:2014 length:1014 start_codon:yes stop_codon:yes gene_type:complete